MSKKFVMLALGAVIMAVPAVASADEAPKSFNACKACHKTEEGKNGVGPSLAGVAGKKAGQAAGFKYSPDFLAANLTWDDATLDKWLTNPKDVVKKTKMAFAGVKKAEERKELIEFLKSLH